MKYQKGEMSPVTAVALGLVAVVLLGWFFMFNGLAMRSVEAPMNTRIDNQVYHESQQYNDGMANRIADFKAQYDTATTQTAKDGIRAAVQVELRSYDIRRLPSQLQSFAYEMTH